MMPESPRSAVPAPRARPAPALRWKRAALQLYTGDGKGKSTASLGLALRAVGAGLHVYYLRLMKPRWKTGERLLLPALGPLLVFRNAAQDWSLRRSGHIPAQVEAMRTSLAREVNQLEKVLVSGRYDVVIADELLYCAHKGLVTEERLLALCDARPAKVELVLTGRGASQALIERADLVTEMRAVKHYMQAGLPARRGIEF